MEPHKAQWMSELSEYANENGLQGKEVIPYGKIPSVSYYLQMPAAFNPWPDLDSFILEDKFALYLEEKAGEESLFPLSGEERAVMEADPKWALLMEFMDRMGYEETFRNEKFAVYQ